jgi:hypothetical protein
MYRNPKFIKTIPANVEGRDFIVGDLHGCFDELGRLLLHVKFDPMKDRLFSTGDLIDRGPRSQDCLGLLTKKWFYAVLGNHEDLALNKIKMLENGENHSLKAEEVVYLKSLAKYVPYILELPLIYEIEHLLLGKVYVVHSEILPEHLYDFSEDEIGSKEYERYLNTMKKFDFSQQIVKFFMQYRDKDIDYHLKQKLLWSRKIVSAFYRDNKEKIDNSDFSFMKNEAFHQKTKIFCGHNVVPFPMKIGQQYYIDTGAALGHSSREVSNYLFSQFGHEFFTLSMVDMTTGICYGCVTSGENKGKIFKLGQSLYLNEQNLK